MDRVHDDFEEPFVVDPFHTFGGVGEGIDVGNAMSLSDETATGEVPPEIIGRELEDCRTGDEEEEEGDDELFRLLQSAWSPFYHRAIQYTREP